MKVITKYLCIKCNCNVPRELRNTGCVEGGSHVTRAVVEEAS